MRVPAEDPGFDTMIHVELTSSLHLAKRTQDRFSACLRTGRAVQQGTRHERKSGRRSPLPCFDASATGFHGNDECILSAVSQNSQPCRHTPRLQIDRVGCLGIGFEGNHIGSTGRSVNDEFTESSVKTEEELSILLLVDEQADASISCEFEVCQYVVELQADHGLALAEIKAIIDEANFTGWQEVFENPEPGGRQNHSGAVGSATRSEGQPEIGMNAESVG